MGRTRNSTWLRLTEISQSHHSILQRHYHLMRFWITDLGASWGALVRALKSEVLHEEELAKKIENGMSIILHISEVYIYFSYKSILLYIIIQKTFLLLSFIDHEGQLSSVHVKMLVTQNDKKLTGLFV